MNSQSAPLRLDTHESLWGRFPRLSKGGEPRSRRDLSPLLGNSLSLLAGFVVQRAYSRASRIARPTTPLELDTLDCLYFFRRTVRSFRLGFTSRLFPFRQTEKRPNSRRNFLLRQSLSASSRTRTCAMARAASRTTRNPNLYSRSFRGYCFHSL
jgi:hypothetical protein